MLKIKYTTQDINHFNRLVDFFDGELFIDGEFPFYTDDRLLDEDNPVTTKMVKRDGKRRSMRMFPTSLDTDAGDQMLSVQTYKQWQPEAKQGNSFMDFVVSHYWNYLTEKQMDFLMDVMNGKEEQYTKQMRFKYRLTIQRRLKKAFLGEGGVDVSNHLVNQLGHQVELVEEFILASDDNDVFTSVLMSHLDKDVVNRIVYELIDSKHRQSIVDFYFGKTDRIPVKSLNAVFEHILELEKKLNSLNVLSQKG